MGTGGDIDAAVLAAANFSQGGLSQKLQLSFSCENLPNMDTFSKSDPFIILYKLVGSVWTKMGMTEVIHDNLNPSFVTKITVDFFFEEQQKFKIDVYDLDDESQLHNLSKQDYIGTMEFAMHEVVTARDQTLRKNVINPNLNTKTTFVTIIAEEITVTANNELVIFAPQARINESGLAFFLIYREHGPGKFIPVYKSEVKKPEGGLHKWN